MYIRWVDLIQYRIMDDRYTVDVAKLYCAQPDVIIAILDYFRFLDSSATASRHRLPRSLGFKLWLSTIDKSYHHLIHCVIMYNNTRMSLQYTRIYMRMYKQLLFNLCQCILGTKLFSRFIVFSRDF